MKGSEYVDPNADVMVIADRLIDLARDAQKGGWPADDIVRALGPLIEATYPASQYPANVKMRSKQLPRDEPKRTQIPFMLKSLDADEVAELLGVTKRYFLDRIRWDGIFPRQANPEGQSPRWIAGEVVDWRISARPRLRRKSARVKRAQPEGPELGSAPSDSTDAQKAFMRRAWPHNDR